MKQKDLLLALPVLITILFATSCRCSLQNGTSNKPSKSQQNQPKICKDSNLIDLDGTASLFVMKVIDQIRCNMHKGIPEMKIPPLDPFKVPDYDVDMQKPNYNIKGNLKNMDIINLSSFSVKKIATDLLDLAADVTVTIPYFVVQGNYDVNGKILKIFPLYGKGRFTIQPINLTASVFVAAGVNDDDYIFLKSLEFNIDVKKMNTRFEGLMGGGNMGKFTNAIVNGFGKYIFRKLELKVHPRIQLILIDEINKLLKKTKLSDVMEKAF